ncbi:MAG: hypothetical protein K2W95_31600 [Candidatus Obscuribacterales bacterium]|nr:hypothetical protein [Candidatus Obscuribacterales bacterium]
MNALLLALICLGLAFASTFILRFISKEVPIVLIGLPVILAGLSAVGAVALLSALGVAPSILGVAGIASALGGGYTGHKLANRFLIG